MAQPVSSSAITIQAVGTHHTITFTGILADGYYSLTIPAASATDAAGNPLAGDLTLVFFVLAGDANHDGTVDNTDVTALVTHWHSTGVSFSQGDFNYDHVVNDFDVDSIAHNWQVTLSPPPPALPSLVVPTPAPKRTASRLVNVIL
jgi:hypothetical protein